MDTEDGQLFIKNLAYFVRTHEKALANALQLQRQSPKIGSSPPGGASPYNGPTTIPPSSATSSSSTFAAALSLPYLNFTSSNIKPAKLTLTPHHLYYLLSRFEELGVDVGPMNVRLENIHANHGPSNYVSFLSQAQRNKRGSDRDSIHSVSSVRSVMSGMTSFFTNLGLSGNNTAKMEKQKAAIKEDLRYLYSAFTKIPCLRLAPDNKARLIAGYEEFPFDTAVPLFVFKTMSALEITDIDFRQFSGWDRLAEQLRSLTIKRGGVEDPTDLLVNIVLDDMDKRRKRSSKAPQSPVQPWPAPSPKMKHAELARSNSVPDSPIAEGRRGSAAGSPQSAAMVRSGSGGAGGSKPTRHRQRSNSPSRPASSRHGSSYRAGAPRMRRSSGSSSSSVHSATPRNSSSNLLALGILPASKWRFLRHLSLADNALTTITAASFVPIANTLQSLDLSSNLFTEIPDSLASMISLRALNLSNCMIESLHSLGRNPLPAITTLNLRGNRLTSLAGIERLLSLERLDIRDNKLTDPTEVARLTGIPNMSDIYVLRNPFVKSHGSYRVTIFNLFRSTPGYIEDIEIDGAGPSYSEKRQLVDRVPEQAHVPPIVKPVLPEVDLKPVVTTGPSPADGDRGDAYDAPRDVVPASSRNRMDYASQSQRRRKNAKRRIVELSQAEHSRSEPMLTAGTPPSYLPAHDSTYGGSTDSTPTRKGSAFDSRHEMMGHVPSVPAPLHSPGMQSDAALADSEGDSDTTPNGGVNGDLYKQRMEALRNEIGDSWLTALGDSNWEGQAQPTAYVDKDFSPTRTIRPVMTPARSPSQGIVSSSRTLG